MPTIFVEGCIGKRERERGERPLINRVCFRLGEIDGSYSPKTNQTGMGRANGKNLYEIK